jgi:hypothetical protein
MLVSYQPTSGDNYCQDCIDAAGDYYVSMADDIGD